MDRCWWCSSPTRQPLFHLEEGLLENAILVHLSIFYCDGPGRMVKNGIPALYVETLSTSMGLAKEKLYQTTGLARPTGDRKIRRRSLLNKGESETVIGLARLVGQVQSLVNESGDARGFDAAKWTAVWLAQPLQSLGGKRPADLMDTADGRTLVCKLLAQQQSGAYA